MQVPLEDIVVAVRIICKSIQHIPVNDGRYLKFSKGL